MENPKQPDEQRAPNGGPLSAAARLNARERQAAEQSGGSATAGSQERPLSRADLSGEVDRLWDQFRDYEKMLVDRIGDVDDDLRATALRFQRAWQTQREETDRRLSRHTRFLGGLALFSILFAGALFLLYRQLVSGPPGITEEVSETRWEPADSSGEQVVYPQVGKRLDRLAAQVAEIRAQLEKPDRKRTDDPRAAGSEPQRNLGGPPPARTAGTSGAETAGSDTPPAKAAAADASLAEKSGGPRTASKAAPQRNLGDPPPARTAGASGAETSGSDTPPAKAAAADASLAEKSRGPRAAGSKPQRDIGGPPPARTAGTRGAETAGSDSPLAKATTAGASLAEKSGGPRTASKAAPQRDMGDPPPARTAGAGGAETAGSDSPPAKAAAANASLAEKSGGLRTADSAPPRNPSDPPPVRAAETRSAETAGGDTPPAKAAAADASLAEKSRGPRTADSALPRNPGDPPPTRTAGAGGAETAGGDTPPAKAATAGAPGREISRLVAKGGYALQLIGYFDRESLHEFVARKELPARVYLIHETYRNRPWHAVIHSLHADLAAAKEARSRLPAELAALEPWIRALPRAGIELRVIETGAGQSMATETAP
ncbi:MAG: hypothetical protein LGR52_15685 [Candidatus Thiosymbion ectosymbiont of Robbea hypermnestra]|nr:hypothetical protein [Candidatus Thiosymbion ectosymbiont of Robbea hypermnestra]